MDSFLSLFQPSDEMESSTATVESAFSDRRSQSSLLSLPLSSISASHDQSNQKQHEQEQQQQQQQFISPEPQSGNIEYKLKLINPTHKRFQHLVTQMKWRLCEGNGFAIYRIGVADNGYLRGLEQHEMIESLKTIDRIVKELNASVTKETEIKIDSQLSVKELRIEQQLIDREIDENRVTVIGPSDGGKSTLVSVLTYGDLDNGWGKARLNMFQHRHEVKSGHTSSIAIEILGFDANGHPNNYRSSELITAEQIYNRSAKVTTFFDLAGHQRYRKTFIHGLCASYPNLLLIVISCTSNVTTIIDYVKLATALEIPFAIVLTKIDLIESEKSHVILNNLRSLMQTMHKSIEIVNDLNCEMCLSNHKNTINHNNNANDTNKDGIVCENSENEIVPVFQLSNVTGSGIDRISKFLSKLESTTMAAMAATTVSQPNTDCPVNFKINKVFCRNSFGPIIVVGYLKSGRIDENATVWLGPKSNGAFEKVIVHLIYRNKTRVKSVKAGQLAAISFHYSRKVETTAASNPLSANIFDEIRSGMVLLRFEDDSQPISTTIFEVVITNNANMQLPFNNPVMMFIENVRQCVSVVQQEYRTTTTTSTSTSTDAKVIFKFLKRPEFIQVGMKFIVCNNSNFVIGNVIRLLQ